MPAEALEQPRFSLVYPIQRVAQMQVRDRAPRSAQLASLSARKRQDRAVKAAPNARGQDADDPLMPAGVVQREPECIARREPLEMGERLVMHVRLDAATLVIERIELRGKCAGALSVSGDEAFDAERH